MSEDILMQVIKAIYRKASSRNPRPKIRLWKDRYEQFVDAIYERYVREYGGLICDKRATEEGEESVLFMGCPIVLTFLESEDDVRIIDPSTEVKPINQSEIG